MPTGQVDSIHSSTISSYPTTTDKVSIFLWLMAACFGIPTQSGFQHSRHNIDLQRFLCHADRSDFGGTIDGPVLVVTILQRSMGVGTRTAFFASLAGADLKNVRLVILSLDGKDVRLSATIEADGK